MAQAIIMPKFGFTHEEAQVITLLKGEGDHVTAGDPLMEVTTDKVNMEVEAPATGILAGLRVTEGDIVPVTTVIGYIVAPGEKPPPAPTAAPRPAASAGPPGRAPAQVSPVPVLPPGPEADWPVAVTPIAARMARANRVDLTAVQGSGLGGRITRRDVAAHLAGSAAPATTELESIAEVPGAAPVGHVRASPAARRVAREMGVALETVSGSGPRGRIQEADVRANVTGAAPASTAVEGPVRRVPFSTMRRTIARNLQRSAQQAPHIYLQADVAMDVALAQVAAADAARAAGTSRVTVTAAVARATAAALRRHPLLNSHLGDEEVLLFEDVHLGIAVALDDGLLVPVVHHADRLDLEALATRIGDLSARARRGRLRAHELQGATFTLSNLGMLGVDRFTAIINPPQVGILAVGRAVARFVPDAADRPVARSLATLTLAVDHRAIDGAVAARFLDDLAQALEGSPGAG